VFGDGEQSRDFTFIDNVVQANILAATAANASGRAFNIAYGEAVTLNEVLRIIGELIDTEIDRIYEDPRPGDILHSLADVSAARELLGYDPRVDFTEGVKRTIEHFR
jgi:nucleoside-diphosphate-sugar epimerase